MLQFVQFSAGVFLNNKVIKIIFILIKLGLNETFNNIETPFNTSKETYDNKQKIFFFLINPDLSLTSCCGKVILW